MFGTCLIYTLNILNVYIGINVYMGIIAQLSLLKSTQHPKSVGIS